MSVITFAVIGMGSRGCFAYSVCQEVYPDRMKVVAVADPDPEKLKLARERFGVAEDMLFDSADALLAGARLADVAVIATPDRQHFSQACAALKKGYHLLLEKPVSESAEECLEIARLAKEMNRQVVVGHVLRYTPFYGELKRQLDGGAVGEIVSVQACENVAYWHQAHSFVRGNWGNSDKSSPMILQKCCHDMDILLWLTGRKCLSVSSFGSLTYFKEQNAPQGAAARCLDCPAAKDCAYDAQKYYLSLLETGGQWPVNVLHPQPNRENVMKALRDGPYGKCVFRTDNNVVDHQVVNLLLEGGATVNFSMCAFTKDSNRYIHVMGTCGEIIGDMNKNTLRIRRWDRADEVIDTSKMGQVNAGHGGGDLGLVRSLLDLISGEGSGAALTSIDRSVESHLVAFAAEKSRLLGGTPVEVSCAER